MKKRTLILLTAAAAAIYFLAGCQSARTSATAWWGAHSAAVGKTAQVVAARAASIAGSVVLDAALNSFDKTKKADFLDGLAGGLRSYQGSYVTGGDIEQIVAAWTPEKTHWRALGNGLATEWQAADPRTPREAAKVLEGLAAGLNAAAAKGRSPGEMLADRWVEQNITGGHLDAPSPTPAAGAGADGKGVAAK
jgi:hypothetical protein